MNRPALFIGSSSEGMDFARAARALLAHDAEVTVWNEGFFNVGGTVLGSLVQNVSRFDFAAVVLTPDDLMTSRDLAAFSPRDNVLFELGLFMGRLGVSRTFLIRPCRDDLKLPTDLGGLTAATYDWPRADGNFQAAVGPACDNIRGMIRNLGFANSPVRDRSSEGPSGPVDDKASNVLRREPQGIAHVQISARAFEIWGKGGYKPDEAERNWFEAERQLRRELGITE